MKAQNKNKIALRTWIIFTGGILLFIAGILVLEFAGHKHHLKGFLLTVAGFIVGGAYGLGIFTEKKRFRVNPSKDQSGNEIS